ncbi:3-hydroxybutyryl-CoA dehydrogenase [Azohydromonas caseinilytica]|uniref:3-hydroxybutyryl-CoA dehydrogenase n=1 Tax=Azohydromonas caseinilytica TaxID=2728836 RepID=A0A848FFP5_9BURK|nr:3-hydroxybutyryl-CoA dehydrogenase [Azohydromonas caseinilytica]NML17966.1 3-hydroxybutyryl-CoA dehydrogenase [Azohydromonas caseinilytica]
MNIERIGVIGAGTMGNGIAQVCAVAGIRVVMVDVSDEAVQRGVKTLWGSLDRLVKKEKLTAAQKDEALARVQGTTDYTQLKDAQIVIEAATENPDLKLRILRQVEGIVGPDAVIASNTSSISITQLAAVLDKPERCIGLHFFNPVPLMGLLEVIRGLQTSDATHALAVAFAQAVGKTPVTVKNSPGFVVNRILCPMINEAIFVLQEGLATAEDIDAGMKLGCNHPIGPLALADLIGLDTMLSIMEVFHEGFGDPKYRPAPLLREMVQAGRLGRKTGRGFYSYDA